MDLFSSMAVSASGLNAQRVVLNVIALNIANAQTTRTDVGGPYLKRQPVLSSSPLTPDFQNILFQKMDPELIGVQVDVVEDPEGVKMIFDPSHPDADDTGLVAFPNVNVTEEMVNLLQATRSYEANVTAFNSAKHMALKALEIGNK